MSNDLISRQDAINACSNGWGYDDETIKHIKSNILDLPPIKPEQKIGRWIESEDEMEVYCSECEEVLQQTMLTNYCPNCGAKMEGEE